MSSNTLKQLKRANEIVDRYLACGSVFPRELRDCGRSDPVRQQEYRDACKIKTWKYSLLGKNRYSCSDEVRDYMDENMPGWRDRVYSHKGRSSTAQMAKASEIVQRYRERGCIRPRRLNDPSREQEYKDAVTLSTWKSALKGHNRVTCSANLRDYLDEHMPGWRGDYTSHGTVSAASAKTAVSTGTETNGSPSPSSPSVHTRPRKNILLAGVARPPPTTEELMPVAMAIVRGYQERGSVLPSLKAECRQDPSRAQECKDAGILHSWKIHTTEKLTPEVLEYLDTKMPGWKKKKTVSMRSRERSPAGVPGAGEGYQQTVQKPKYSPLQLQLLKAREVATRCHVRRGNGQAWMPRHLPGRQETPHLILEQKDAIRLSEWKRAALVVLHGGQEQRQEPLSQPLHHVPHPLPMLLPLPTEVKAFLDKDLPGWMAIDSESPASFPPSSGLLLMPSSSSSYNNKAAGDSNKGCNSLHSLSHSALLNSSSIQSIPPSLPVSSMSAQQLQLQPVMLAARKRGIHMREKPIRRLKKTTPTTVDTLCFQPIPSMSESEKKEDNEILSEEDGVAALLQLCGSRSSSVSPQSQSSASSKSIPSGDSCNSSYGNDSHSYVDSKTIPVPASVPVQQLLAGREGSSLKRSRDLTEERDWWGGSTTTPASPSTVSATVPLTSKRLRAASENDAFLSSSASSTHFLVATN